MAVDLLAVSIAGGMVRSVDRLRVGGRLTLEGADVVVELPAWTTPPAVGDVVQVRPILGRWPDA